MIFRREKMQLAILPFYYVHISMISFIIFDTTVPEDTPLSLLLVRWGSLFFSCFVLYSPTTTDIYPLFTCDPLQFTLNTLRLFCTVRTEILYIFFIYCLFKVVIYPLASLIYLRFRVDFLS